MLTLLVSVIFLNITKRNISAVILFTLQSIAISMGIFAAAWQEHSVELFFVGIFTLVVKGIISSVFFRRVIVRYSLQFSGTTYLNTPLTLIVVALLVGIAYSQLFTPLYVALVPPELFFLMKGILSALFVTLFLMVNKKGALSQIVGILSLENAIILIALLLGLRHSLQLEIAITFDITVWIVIAVVFLEMLYRQFGSFDVSTMNNLKE